MSSLTQQAAEHAKANAALRQASIIPGQAIIVETDWYDSLATSFTDENSVQLLECGREFFPALEDALNKAKREIYFETYIFEHDASGLKVAQALADAARRGVKVYVVTDGFGTAKLHADFVKQFTTSGVNHEVFRPSHAWFSLSKQQLRRLHRKLCVIDGEQAFVGGINVLDDYWDTNHGKLAEPRFDFAVRVKGPILPSIHLAVTRMWWQLSVRNRPGQRLLKALNRETQKTPLALPKTIHSTVTPAGAIRAMFVLRDNSRFRNRIENAYVRALYLAKREALIANAYFFPGRRFRTALLDAAKRGVKVKLLLQGRPEYWLQHQASQSLYDDLLQAGIEIFEYKRSFLHAKVAVIDDWATVGSSNIDPFSLLLAREANVLVEDKHFASELRAKVLAGASEGGAPVQAHIHVQRAWYLKLLHRFSYKVLRLGVMLAGAANRY